MPSPKIKLDEVDRYFYVAKEEIKGVIHINLQDITRWIKTPSSTMVRIEVYVGKWKMVKKREITSEILRVEIHLEQPKSQDIDFLMDLDSQWHFFLGQT